MNTFLLWMHPLVQAGAALIGFWAMWQGIKRVQMLLGKKTIFPWKQHVKLGTWALCQWTFGASGFYTAYAVFGYTHITGLHADLAWPIVGLSLFGLASGYVMVVIKKSGNGCPSFTGFPTAS